MGEKGGKNLDRDSQPLRLPKTTQKTVATTAASERSRLRAAMTKSSVEAVKKSVEKHGDLHKEYYKMSEAVTNGENVKLMRRLNPVVLVGSVDSTRFQQVWYRASFYKPYIKAAAQLSKLESKLDPSTKQWLKDLKPALDAFVKMSGYEGSDKVLKRKYHADIWKLVRKHGDNIVYGPKGVFNFLLAFRRVVNIYSNKLEDLPAGAIKLTLGKGLGPKKGQKDRYAYMLVKKEKPVSTPAPAPKPKSKPKTTPTAAPKTKQKPQPKSKTKPTPAPAPAPASTPKPKPKTKPAPAPQLKSQTVKFDTPEFYKKYKIAKPDEFRKYAEKLKEAFSDKTLKELSKDDFWENLPGESDGEKHARLINLLGSKSRGYRKLYIEMNEMNDMFQEWFNNADDPKSRKYQNIYFWLIKRQIEFVDDYQTNQSIKKDRLINYHIEIVSLENLITRRKEKYFMGQLVLSCKFLSKYDVVDEDRKKWQKILDKM